MPQPIAPTIPGATFTGDPFAATQDFKTSRENIAKDKQRDKFAQEALFLHLAKQQGRAAELNTAAAPEVGFTTEEGTGATVALEQPLPKRNPHVGGLMPLDQPGALEARGYLTPDGKATPSGRLFLELHKQGMFDEKGLLTDKGRAFTLDSEEALLPQNLDAYAIRDRSGLNDAPKGPGLVDTVWNLGAGIFNGGRRLFGSPKGRDAAVAAGILDDEMTEREAEAVISNQEALKQVVGSSAQLGSGIATALAKGTAKLFGSDMEYYAAKQAHDSFKADFEDVTTGELYGLLLDSKDVIDTLDGTNKQAQELLGPERSAQVKQEGGIAGGVLLDPTNIITAGIGSSVAKGGAMLKLSAKADRATQAAFEAQELAMKAAKAKTVLEKTQAAAAIAAKQADNLANMGRATRAQPFRELAARMTTKADEAAAALAPLQASAAERATFAAKLAEDAGGAQAIAQSVATLKEVGRKVRAAPAQAVAPVLELIGDGLIKADKGLELALGKIGMSPQVLNVLRASAAGAGVFTVGPAASIPALLASGPLVRGVGNFSRVVGKELLQARGSVPFWQRVAQNSTLSATSRATAHLMDSITLGGKVFDPVRRAAMVGKGIAAAAPVDIAFESLAEGGEFNSETIKQGLAESILFAGGAATANAVVRGKVQDLRAKAAGDEVNFRRTLAPDQLRSFGALPKGARKAMSVYSAVFPTLKFQMKEGGGGGTYDRRTNTAIIDTTSPDALRPLIAHEVNHHIQIKAQMEEGIRAALVGDGITGGLLRSADGTLDPNFKAARDAYNERMVAEGSEPLNDFDFAVEYFNEATVDDLMGKLESGELQRRAGRSNLERMVRGIVRETIGKVPFARDLSLKMGGAFDKDGKMVQGNGLLADGIRNLPFAKTMLRDALREQAGRPATTLADDKAPAVTIPAEAIKGNKPLVDSLFSDFKTDADGNAILGADGLPQFIDRETMMKRVASGLILEEITRAKIERGDALPPGEFAPQDDGTYKGTHFSNEHITALRDSGHWNTKQIASLRMLNKAAKDFTGETFLVLNQPALKMNKLGKKVYDGIGLTFRESVPVAVSTTKKGNILIHIFSVTKFRENVRNRAQSARGKRLYNGNEVAIQQDAEAVMNLHKQGLTTDAYFAEKYGAQVGQDYKKFINTVFGLMTKEQRSLNPVFDADKISEKTGVYRTYRLDRINQTTRLQGTPMPFVYESVKMNHFPNGVPDGKQAAMSSLKESESVWGVPLYQRIPGNSGTVRLFHGTWRGGFESFKEGTHMTRSPLYAERYTSPSASSMGWSGSKEVGKQSVYAADVTFKKLFDTRDREARDLFNSEFYMKNGTGTPIGERGLPDWTDGVDLTEWLEENHPQYDGIVLDEGAEPVGDTIRVRPESYIPLSGAKVKIISKDFKP